MLNLPTNFLFTAVPIISIVNSPVEDGEPTTPILSALSNFSLTLLIFNHLISPNQYDIHVRQKKHFHVILSILESYLESLFS